jgi:uncharacterized protein (DUF58 family)
MLLVVLGGVWLMAYLWVRSLAQGLRLTREMRFGWAQVGDRVEERFTLSNTSWMPAQWVEIIDHSTLLGYQASRVTGIDGDSENHWSIWSVCSRRGAFVLGPTTLRSGDPFGVYTVTLECPLSITMLVLPPVVPLPDIQIAPGARTGEGRRRIEALERTVNASSVRDYIPGDSLSRIHWATTAHRDALSVRLFDNTPTSDWWIFLDLDQRVQVGQGQDSTLEHGVILAASLATQGLQSGRAVGVVAHGEGLVWLPPQRGEPHRWRILRELALVSTGSHSLQDVLAHAKSYFKLRSSLVVITPATKGDWVKALVPLLRWGVAPTVLLFDPISFGGTGDTRGILALLNEMEISNHIITHDVLDRPEARPGRAGYWEWRASPLGKAVAIQKPHDTNWKVFA